MEKVKRRVPALRFPEFVSLWSDKSLGLIARFAKGKGISKSDISSSGQLECIRYGELYTSYGEIITNIASRTSIPKEQLILSEVDDVIIPASGETQLDIARASCVRKQGVALGGDINVIRTELYGPFLAYYLSSAKKMEIAKLAQGNSVVHLYSSQLKALRINTPKKEEQQKIASFLSSVDKKIEQLKRKKELLEQYKKGVMQQIFSQEIRFKDDDGKDYPEWEEKQLGKILLSSRLGGNYANTETKSSYPLIKMGNLGRGKIKLDKIEYVSPSETISEEDSVKYGDLFLNTRNTLDLVGKVAIWRDELEVAYYNSNLMYLKFENNMFMNYRLNSYEGIKALRRLATGTTSVAAIYSRDLLKMKLKIPGSNIEQTKIAEFLNTLDQKIDLVQKETEQNQHFKKGLLQQMFV